MSNEKPVFDNKTLPTSSPRVYNTAVVIVCIQIGISTYRVIMDLYEGKPFPYISVAVVAFLAGCLWLTWKGRLAYLESQGFGPAKPAKPKVRLMVTSNEPGIRVTCEDPNVEIVHVRPTSVWWLVAFAVLFALNAATTIAQYARTGQVNLFNTAVAGFCVGCLYLVARKRWRERMPKELRDRLRELNRRRRP